MANEHVHPTIREILHTADGIKDKPLLTEQDMAYRRDSEMRIALECIADELEIVWTNKGQINPNRYVTYARLVLAKYPKV